MSTTTVYVHTLSRSGQVGAWSRYVFPFHVDNFTQKDNALYIRAGNDVLRVDEQSLIDFAGEVRAQPFECVVQWNWLDFGTPGQSKELFGIDIANMRATATDVQVGYNQNDKSQFTAPITVPGDTVPGQIVPIPCNAPSFAMKLTYGSLQDWQLQAITVYVNDEAVGS